MRHFAGTILLLSLLIHSSVYGRSIRALFHPYDPTLAIIAEWIKQSEEAIDIAMYSLDFSITNPVIEALMSEETQTKIRNGSLKIRMIYEGYGGKEASLTMSRNLEGLGIDVRFLASGRKVHHKFAIFDYKRWSRRLVTGSANWSLTSYQNYNESLLQIEGEPELLEAFQEEFDLLWSASEETGDPLVGDISHQPLQAQDQSDVEVFFNTENFIISGPSIVKNNETEGFVLTRQIVQAIQQAQKSIKIATTRIQLRPIYQALLEAANRGINISIIVNMDQYAFKNQRKNWKLTPCTDDYETTCSTGINFSYFLSEGASFPGKDHIHLRIKFTNLNPASFLMKQMHSKYIIVDNRFVYSGSFNWSYSGEYNHLENLIFFDGTSFQDARDAFLFDFERLFSLGREDYAPFIRRLEEAFGSGTATDCRFEPMALTFAEVDYLLDTGARHGTALKNACL